MRNDENEGWVDRQPVVRSELSKPKTTVSTAGVYTDAQTSILPPNTCVGSVDEMAKPNHRSSDRNFRSVETYVEVVDQMNRLPGHCSSVENTVDIDCRNNCLSII